MAVVKGYGGGTAVRAIDLMTVGGDSPKGVVSVQEQENKQSEYNSAIARLKSASADVDADQGDVDRLQALADFKNITAPFDGMVTARGPTSAR